MQRRNERKGSKPKFDRKGGKPKSLNNKRMKLPGQEYDDYDDDFEQQPKKQFKSAKGGFDKKNNQQGKPAKEFKKEKGDKGDRKEKKDGIGFHDLNKLYNELMNTKTKDGRSKTAIVEDILKSTSGIITQIVTKHDGCRVVQGCLMHGTPEQRQKIITTFLTNNLADLAKTKYGHFLPIKMIPYLDKKQLNHCMEIFMKHTDILMTSKEGAQVIAAFLKAGASKSIVDKQLDPILNIKDEDATTHERLENTALRIVEKGAYQFPLQQKIVAESIRILIPGEREKILETVINDLPNFLISKEGVYLVCTAIDYMQPKDKKLLIKNLKGKVKELLSVENTFFHVVLMKLFTSVDDTVLLKKNVINEINKDLEELISNPHMSEVLLSIYDPQEDYLAKYLEKKSAESNTKKDTATRTGELIDYTLEPLVNLFSFNLGEYIADPKYSKLLYHIIKSILDENKEGHFKIINTTIETIIQNYNKSDKSGDLQKDVLISHAHGHRLVKSIINHYQNYTGDAKDFYGEVIEKIYEFVIKELSILLNTKAIFIVIALIESTHYNDQIIQEVKQQKHLVKTLKGAGADILRKHL